MKKFKRSKPKKRKKARKTKKTKKVKKLKKPRKVLKKRVPKKKKLRKVKKPKKKVRVKRTARKKKPVRITKPKIVAAAPMPAPAPVSVGKVPYTQENAILCICTKCPIQSESTCAGMKVREMEAMMEKGIPAGMMPPPADVPGLYCSTGAATCKDLDTTKMCVCTVCPVWDKYKLEAGTPMGYFCRDGKAT